MADLDLTSGRAGWVVRSGVLLLATLCAAVTGLIARPYGVTHAQTVCGYRNDPLGQLVPKAPVIVLADAIKEVPDRAAGFTTTLRVLSTLKGRVTAPEIAVGDLGHLNLDCDGGPRLLRGNRYVLFLQSNGAGPSAAWSLVDQDGGVFQLTAAGVRFPPEQGGGAPQLLPIAPAEFLRDVGVSLLDDNPARIESVITNNGLQETIERPGASQPAEKPWYERLPRRETAIAVAGGAVMFASLIFLLWRPREPDPYRRP